MTAFYNELLQHWTNIEDTGRDKGLVRKIQEQVIAYTSRNGSGQGGPAPPVAPVVMDDSTLSALDDEIAAMSRVTSGILAGEGSTGAEGRSSGGERNLTGAGGPI